MKRIYINALTSVLSLVLLASCLDDDKQPLDPTGYQNVIEFGDISVPASPAGSIYPLYSTAFAVSPQASFETIIKFAGPQSNDKDIQVTIAVDPVALADYNEQMEELNGSTFELLPAENYSIPTMTYTIPKGQASVSVPITVFPDKFDLARSFAIPLRIVSASSGIVSGNFGVAILATVAKNQYDAAYETNVQMTNWNYTGVGISDKAEDYPDYIGLVTTGPNSVSLFNYLRGDNLQPGFSANADGSTGATGFGAATPEFTFDASGKLVSVVNTTPDDGRGRAFVINAAAPAGHNQFNATTRSVTLNYFFKQNGRPDSNVIMIMTFAEERS
jgi:hypothetical protein